MLGAWIRFRCAAGCFAGLMLSCPFYLILFEKRSVLSGLFALGFLCSFVWMVAEITLGQCSEHHFNSMRESRSYSRSRQAMGDESLYGVERAIAIRTGLEARLAALRIQAVSERAQLRENYDENKKRCVETFLAWLGLSIAPSILTSCVPLNFMIPGEIELRNWSDGQLAARIAGAMAVCILVWSVVLFLLCMLRYMCYPVRDEVRSAIREVRAELSANERDMNESNDWHPQRHQECGACGKVVSMRRRTGEKCPWCGAYWSFRGERR